MKKNIKYLKVKCNITNRMRKHKIESEFTSTLKEVKEVMNEIKDNDFFSQFEDITLINDKNFSCLTFTEKGVKLYNGAAIRVEDRKLGSIVILVNEDTIELFKLEVFEKGKGLGTNILKELNKISCLLDLPIYLDTGKPGNGGDNTREQEIKRERFYTKCGLTKIVNKHFGGSRFTNRDMVEASFTV